MTLKAVLLNLAYDKIHMGYVAPGFRGGKKLSAAIITPISSLQDRIYESNSRVVETMTVRLLEPLWTCVLT